MSDRNFSRRRAAACASAPAAGWDMASNSPTATPSRPARKPWAARPRQEKVYEHRHAHEIERAENIAAGLPPEGVPSGNGRSHRRQAKRDFREPNLETPAEVQEEKPFEPVPVKEQPKGIVETIRAAATNLVKKVQRLIKPVKKIHKEVIINAETLETRVAVLEEGRLEEFTIERTTEERLVGSIFKGKVRNLEDGLKAAFVDIGFEKNAFLHYWDIVPSSFDSGVEIVERDGRRRDKPKITQKDIPRLYPPGQRDHRAGHQRAHRHQGPARHHQPRAARPLPGAAAQLRPERHLPQDREPAGAPAPEEDPARTDHSRTAWASSCAPSAKASRSATSCATSPCCSRNGTQIQERIKSQPPATCVFQEPDLIERTVRDFLTEDVERIVVDSPKAYDRMREMISKISKRSADKVKLYTDPQPIFDRFNITRQLENAFSRQVHLKSGGYIVVDETEALVAIDVNTGRHKGGKDQETTILKVNLEAADEISRQLRLRNMGGLIVLDFIDMKSRRDQQQVYQRMKEGLRRDKAKTHVLPISQLGLMEMTRQRHSESVHAAVYDDCPYCKGRGKVKSALTMSVEIQRKLSEILKKRSRDESDFQLRIVVHPTILERLRTEDEKHLIEMEKRYFGKLSFRADPALHAEQFKIVNVANQRRTRQRWRYRD